MAQVAPNGFTKLVDERADTLGLSYREIARRAKVSVSFLSRVLAGDRGLPGDEVLLRIASALEIDPPQQLLAEAGRVPQSKGLIKLMRAATELTTSELEEVNRVAADLRRKRRKRVGK